MPVSDAIFLGVVLLGTPLLGLIAWAVSKIIDHVQEREDEVEELRERVKDADEALTGLKEALDHTEVLLRKATDRADRLAAMNQGLAEDLAVLKAYNPEEVEERLRKIREIKANEERVKQEEKIKQLIDMCVLNAQLNILAGTPAQIAAQGMLDRISATQYRALGR